MAARTAACATIVVVGAERVAAAEINNPRGGRAAAPRRPRARSIAIGVIRHFVRG
jgi:hypothetical protein